MPTDYYDLIDEGVEHFEAFAYEKALKSFSEAFRLQPDSPICTFNLARTLEELGNPLAETFYYAAVKLGSVDALYQLAFICIANKREAEGIGYLRRYLSQAEKTDDEYGECALDTVEKFKDRTLHVVSTSKNISVKTG